MKRFFASSLILLGVISGLYAQETSARKQDHDELRALTKTVTTALNNKDYDKLAGCFVDDYAFIAVDQRVIEGKDGLKNYYEAVLKNPKFGIDKIKIEPKADILTKFIGSDVGYCYGTAKNTYIFKDGMVVEMASRWSATLNKKNGKWKVVMVHAGVNFLDNPVLDKVAGTAKGTMISMAILVFLLIAVILFLLVKNKKLAKTKTASEPSATPAPPEDKAEDDAPGEEEKA